MATKEARYNVLVCKSHRRRGHDGWSFPAAVADLLRSEFDRKTVLHLFGGKADFGTRLDIDPRVSPDVIGDAWHPPFGKDSFDVVILDPPYIGAFRTMSNQKTRGLMAAAAWIARETVVWFHPIWLESPTRCLLDKAWLVVVGRHCQVRALQFFQVAPTANKVPPLRYYTRGPALKYNRWLVQPERLPGWLAKIISNISSGTKENRPCRTF